MDLRIWGFENLKIKLLNNPIIPQSLSPSVS
jgi:hypothetical protein